MWIDDQLLLRCHETVAISCWTPSTSLVVLGASNRADIEANLTNCQLDQVPILKRYGGGGTVVLHHGCVVVSIGCWIKQPFQNKHYFGLFNNVIIQTLARTWPELAGLSQAGLSDIIYEDRKVAGTSLFRSRNYALYQASLLVDPCFDLIDRYLQHPSREPDYRQGRTHRDFLVGIGQLVPGVAAQEVESVLRLQLQETYLAIFGAEMIAPQPAQFEHLLARAKQEGK